MRTGIKGDGGKSEIRGNRCKNRGDGDDRHGNATTHGDDNSV